MALNNKSISWIKGFCHCSLPYKSFHHANMYMFVCFLHIRTNFNLKEHGVCILFHKLIFITLEALMLSRVLVYQTSQMW